MLMSTGGTVIRVPAEGIKRSGRSTQGVIVMRLREGENVSTLARVVEQDEQVLEGPAESLDGSPDEPEASLAAPTENGGGPSADGTS
jgi:DNA gyrase subunit A